MTDTSERLAAASRDVEDLLARTFGAHFHVKQDAEHMKIVGELLGVVDLVEGVVQAVSPSFDIGLPSKSDWFRWGTTLGPFVYLDRDLPHGFHRLRMATHEVSHVYEGGQEGYPKYAMNYLFSQEGRTAREVGPYLAECEVVHWLTGKLPPSLAEVVRIDHGYALDSESESVAFGGLLGEQAATEVALGVYRSVVGRRVISFLEEKYSELKGTVPA